MPTGVRGQVQIPGAVALAAVLVSAALVPGDAAQEPVQSGQVARWPSSSAAGIPRGLASSRAEIASRKG